MTQTNGLHGHDEPSISLSPTNAHEFVLLFSQSHPQFRRAEFESVCRLCGLQSPPAFSPNESHLRTIQLVGGEPAIRRLLRRSVLLKSAYQFLFKAPSHEGLLEQLNARKKHLFQPFNDPRQSWCLQVRPQMRKRDKQYNDALIQLYAPALGLTEAPIELDNANNKFTIFEIYDPNGSREEPSEVLLARLVHYGLSTRRYIGNSTMDPELAFIHANLALARPGTLAFDPFCGTGGLLLPAAHFGSHVLGVEIKWDVAKAKGKSSRATETWLYPEQSVRANFVQYGLDDGRYLGILLADSSQHGMWRLAQGMGGMVDAILADPPYGIRERGQKLGTDTWKYKKEDSSTTSTDVLSRGGQQKHYPEKQRYQMSSVFLDLLDLGARLLRIGGRLAFWFPIRRSEYSEKILPRSECMQLVYNCEQPLAKDTSRLLLVYDKIRDPQFFDNIQLVQKAYFEEDCYGSETFRQKIFNNTKNPCKKQDC